MSKGAPKKATWLLWSGLATVVVSQISSEARAQVRGTVDVSAEGIVGSSPFLQEGNENGAVSVRLQVSPSILYEGDEVTTAALRGIVAVDSYDVENGTIGTLGLTGGIQHLLSEKTSVGLDASVRSTRSPVRDFLLNPTLSGEVLPRLGFGSENADSEDFGPGALVGFDPDLTETGRQGRTNSYQMGASLNHALSSLDSLFLGASVRFNKSDDPTASDYRSDRLTASYRRTLSSRTGVNAGISFERADYEGDNAPRRGDGTFITPTVGISHRFNETLAANFNLGVSITEVQGPEGVSKNDVGLAGSFDLCQLQFNGSLCGTASRSAQATAFGGVASVTTAAVTYNRTLSLRDSVNVNARYSRRDASLLPVEGEFDGSQSVFAASAAYNRMVAEQLYAFVRPSYARVFGGIMSEDRENYQISLGIRYRFGNSQ